MLQVLSCGAGKLLLLNSDFRGSNLNFYGSEGKLENPIIFWILHCALKGGHLFLRLTRILPSGETQGKLGA